MGWEEVTGKKKRKYGGGMRKKPRGEWDWKSERRRGENGNNRDEWC